MRLSLQIGLNHNIPESQLIDPVERQHRVRIWWTIYIFDRMWGSKMGMPSQILDDDIHVDMPSRISPAQVHDEQFSDPDYQTANIELARIVGETIAKLYSRRKYSETFLQRVQKLLKALKNWVDTLPDHLRLNENDPEMNQKHISSLHLAFNQVLYLASSFFENNTDLDSVLYLPPVRPSSTSSSKSASPRPTPRARTMPSHNPSGRWVKRAYMQLATVTP